MKTSLLTSLLNQCRRKIKKHPPSQFLHWTFFIKDGKIVSTGINRNSEPNTSFGYHVDRDSGVYVPKIHAELDAIRRVNNKHIGHKIIAVNVRLNQSGEIRMSRPCNACRINLKRFGCTKIYYTTNYGWGFESI
jgi:deoxycytidylate deaminase